MILNTLAQLAASPSGALFNQTIGLIGLLLGTVGFAVTLVQIGRVKTVASAQRDAISGLSFRLSQLDITAECAKAETALGEIRKFTLDSTTDVPIEIVDRLATAFVSILEGSAAVSDEVRERLRDAISDLNKVTSTPARKRPDNHSSATKQLAALRDYHGIITKIRAQVQEDHKL